KKKREKDIPKISVNTLLLQNGAFRYNLLTSPCKEENVFDKNHVSIEDLLINASIKGYTNDSININVRALRLREKSGFTIKNIAFKLIGNKERVNLKNFSFAGKNSNIFIRDNEITMPKDMNFNEFIDRAEFNFGLDNSEIVLSDFSPFVPKLKDFNTPTNVTCRINGYANHLILDTLGVNYNDGGLVASGYGSIDNLFPEPKDAFLFGNMSYLNINSKSVINILNDMGIELNNYSVIRNIGNISFNGEISGFVSKLVTYGNVKCGIGNVSADMLLESDEGLNFKGKVKSNNINIGKLVPDKGLGNVAFDLNLNGKHSDTINKGKVEGEINLFEYNNYQYNNIAINALYNDKEYNGSVSLNDTNIVLNLDGMMNLSERNKEFALKIKGDSIRLNDINLTKRYENSVLNFDIEANFTGDRIDNADGLIAINSLEFKNNGLEYNMNGAYIEANNSNTPQYIALESEIIEGHITGNYTFSSLKNSVLGVLSEVMPSFIDKVEAIECNNSFEFEFVIPDT
ncbi:MAG: hypothetical protein IJA28_01085, partial [Coprobacter sp.]|nr:hypothetical protein [Coprobacter sp.]